MVNTPLTRRTLIRLGAGGLAGTALASVLSSPAWADIRDHFAIPIPDMSSYDLAGLDRSQFSAEEQRIAGYLVSMADVANNLEDTDPDDVGWFNGGYSVYPVEALNARLQESVWILTFFYTYQAPWNPYRLDPVLRDHIYAAMRYYLVIQQPDGAWPRSATDLRNRACTGFGLVSLGMAVVAMDAVGWNASVRAEVIAGLLKAADYFLDPTNTDVWTAGPKVSNQIIGGLDGIGRILHLLPARVGQAYDERLDFLLTVGQSSGAGYLYEDAGFDAHYSLYTSLRDLAVAYERTNDQRFLTLALNHLDWCQYNFLWEPDGVGYTVNGVSTRMQLRSLPALRTANTSSFPDYLNLFKQSPIAVALNWTAEYLTTLQQSWAAGAVPVAKLAGSELNPANLNLTDDIPVYPTESQRNAAIATFPYFRTDAFVEERSDSRYGQHFAFVNRPGYYLATYHGTMNQTAGVVHRGPSTLYHHTTGALVATQMRTDSFWGTRLDDGYVDVDQTLNLVAGGFSQTQDFSITYADAANRVRTNLTCRNTEIAVRVAGADAVYTHRIPLVVHPDDDIVLVTSCGEQPPPASGPILAAGLRLRRGTSMLEIVLTTAAQLTLVTTPTTLFGDAGQRTITQLNIRSNPSEHLLYTLRIEP